MKEKKKFSKNFVNWYLKANDWDLNCLFLHSLSTFASVSFFHRIKICFLILCGEKAVNKFYKTEIDKTKVL